jgi:hypothetical protein
MAETGEKYTEARRALLTPASQHDGAGPVIHHMTVADEYVAKFGAHQDAWQEEYPTAALAATQGFTDELRDLYRLRDAAQPVIWVLIKLSATGFPGVDLDADAGWAAMLAVTRRDLITLRGAGIDAALVKSHLGLIDIVESKVGLWPGSDWAAAVRGRVRGLIDARDSGRHRGQQMSSQSAVAEPTVLDNGAWTLRHPPDHYFSLARARMTDPALLTYLVGQIAAFAPSYTALAARDWSSGMSGAEVIVEVQILDPATTDWKQPVPATVVRVHRGNMSPGSQVGLRLVADADATFNGKLLNVLGGERWLVCGALREDGTLLPLDGTRRQPPLRSRDRFRTRQIPLHLPREIGLAAPSDARRRNQGCFANPRRGRGA